MKQVLYNTEVCCIGGPKETPTVVTSLQCWTHPGKTDGAFHPPPQLVLSATAQKLLPLVPTVEPSWSVSPKAAARSQGTGCGVAGWQQPQPQEPGKCSEIHSCDKELRPGTHSSYVLYKFQYYLRVDFTHTMALGRLQNVCVSARQSGESVAIARLRRSYQGT